MFLVAGDVLALYLSLFMALVLRYSSEFSKFADEHVMPFTIIFGMWLLVFYIAGLYDPKRLRNDMEFLKTLSLAITVNAVLAMLFFYAIPYFTITPKTTLLIFVAVFTAIEITWRRSFNRATATFQDKTKIALIGDSDSAEEIAAFIENNPQLGYQIAARIKSKSDFASFKGISGWKEFVEKNGIDLIVIPRYFKNEPDAAKIFYGLLTLGTEITDLPAFYEAIFQKVPIDEVSEEWFLDEIVQKERFYDGLKRWVEFLFALALGIVLLPLELLIAIIVKLTSRGPVLIKQTRVGKLGKEFTLYKFRSMVALSPEGLAETGEAKWAAQNDARVTPFGKFLRASHLDELPQLINIIKGEISFAGPRPERPEFTKILQEKIPHYDVRHLIKPGVTGWAQINYRYGASEEDSAEKLKYDIYYLKNRSLILDIAIIIKTLKSFFINQR